jgi:hypothetical protein
MLARSCVSRHGLPTTPQVALLLTCVALVTHGCGGASLRLAAHDAASANQGTGDTSRAGGNFGTGGVPAAGGTSAGGLLFTGGGGAPGAGGSSTVCIPPPCIVPSCGDGFVMVDSNTCDCSGPCGCPCGCWTCVPVPQPGSGGATGQSTAVPSKHRSSSASCPSQRGPAPSCAGTMCSSCSSDSQCTDGVNGRCFPTQALVGPGGCSYDECFSGSDCGSKTPCLCRTSSADASANVCNVAGNCAVDADCGPGGYCSPSVKVVPGQPPNVCWGSTPYYCHTASDLCLNDADCAPLDAGSPTPGPPTNACAYNPQGNRWECTQGVCALP